MNNQYFTWKDGKKNTNGVQDWTEITAKEYLDICRNSKDRPIEESGFFMKVSGVGEGDTNFFFECDLEDYLKYRAEKERKYRKKVQRLFEDMKYGQVQILSLDAEYEDESGEACTLHDLIEDKDSLFEDKTIESMDLENALSVLSDEEMKIINALFLSEETVSERKYAKQINVPQKTLNNRKNKIFQKMKKSLAQN